MDMIMIPSQSFFFFLVSLVLYALASPTLQRDALLEFKNEFPFNAAGPDAFDYLSTWNTSSSDYCSWKGVTCDAKSNEVISLVLDSISLNSSLKSNSSLFKLQHLRNLSLVDCDLIGEIPSSLGKLSHLAYLDLSNNDLVGEIPSSLGNRSHLIELDLSINYLVGEIPPSIGNLMQLSGLNLGSNNLIGKIPSSLGNLSYLIELVLYGNYLVGEIPSSIGNLKQLSGLNLWSNNLTGKIPSSLGNLSRLTILSLSNNHFKSTLPFDLNRLHKLESFYVAQNNFHGPIPEYISGFLNLGDLDLSHNSFIGPIPRSMFKLVSLSLLDLSYNKLEGQVPSFLWTLDSLKLSQNYFTSLEKPVEFSFHVRKMETQFDLASNSLQGVFPQWMCKFSSLGFLDLSNNHLTGSIPSCLMNSIDSLKYLKLRNNNISGFLPDINATYLRSLDVSRNQLVGKLPKSLINCKKMELLNLKGNKIKDTFPSWLGSLGSLRVLLLGSNAFYGPISGHFGFQTLRIIDISHNDFNGTLPQDYFVNWLEMSSVEIEEWFQRMKNPISSIYMGTYSIYDHEVSMDMIYKGVETEFPRILIGYKAIDFSGNKFEGRIPKSIGLLKGLRFLNLSGNAFTGNIPSSLANITNLEALDLSRNKLSGHIPRDLGNLSFVSYLDFSHNLLEGPVPRGTQFQTQNCSSYEDNLGLIGLEEICGKIHVPEATSQQPDDYSSQHINWVAAAIAYVPGVFCGLVIGHIFISHKHEWFADRFRRKYPRGTISAH